MTEGHYILSRVVQKPLPLAAETSDLSTRSFLYTCALFFSIDRHFQRLRSFPKERRACGPLSFVPVTFARSH
jgi:hypothetical protein